MVGLSQVEPTPLDRMPVIQKEILVLCTRTISLLCVMQRENTLLPYYL